MAINVILLQEKGQSKDQATHVAKQLAEFIRAAKRSIHIAAYHFALKDPHLVKPVQEALKDRADANVEIRIGYYFEHKFNPRDFGAGTQPTGTEAFLGTVTEGTDIELKPIRGTHLMHNKYVVRDAHTDNAAVWTGSTNFTDGAWKMMENNIVLAESPNLAAYYENDFGELWATGEVQGTGTGALDNGSAEVDGVRLDVAFAPGKGKYIDQLIAEQISAARERIKISSMVISSGTILGALLDAIAHEQVPANNFGGIYDGPEMAGVLKDWQKSPNSASKESVFQQVAAKLVKKNSRPFDPAKPDADYNYMHNKVVVCDDVVVTGSFNFSRNATMNAENMLLIHSKLWADMYAKYIDQLVRIYGG
jgi:phosphatidylserine/phosphatidylglycerophosphate/cardiolipin synthase-like enzyme